MTVVPSIGRILDRPLADRPDATAIVARDGALTYRELDVAIDVAAGALWESGVRQGDRVAASLPNGVDIVVAFHAAMRLGAVWVGIPQAYPPAEQTRLLRHAGVRVFLTTPTAAAPAVAAEVAVLGTDGNWRELLEAGLRPPSLHIDPYAPAAIAFTSGTTGSPKGIVHSQHNLLLPGEVLVASRGYGPDLRKGDSLPLTILNLMALSTVLTAQAGGCAVLMDRRDAVGIAEWIRTESVTTWNAVPPQLRDMLHNSTIQPDDLASLTEIWCGGTDLPDALRTDFEQKFGVPIRLTYGLTEAPTIVSIDSPGRRWQPGASGVVLPHLDVRSAESGELTVRAAASGPWAGAYTPMLGLWNGAGVDPTPGPLHTGDLGSVDEDGWLTVVGRRKMVIVRGGANVYPAEVENVLKAVPGVGDAVVFGIPDARLGERVCALIELASDGEYVLDGPDLHRHCMDQLAKYKVPESWAVVDTLPRNSMGKVVRTDLPALFGSADPLPNHSPV